MEAEGWTLRGVVFRTTEILRQNGLGVLWFKILGETCYRRMLLLEKRLDDEPCQAQPDPAVTLQNLKADEAHLFGTLRPHPGPDVVKARLDAGCRCFVARQNGKIVAAAWAATERWSIDYLRQALPLGDADAYLFEVFTSPTHRGLGIGSALVNFAYNRLYNQGLRRVLLAVNFENPAALRLFAAHGEQVRSVLGCVWIGPYRRHFTRATHPSAGLPEFDGRSEYWSAVSHRVQSRSHYMGEFLARLKKRAYLSLIDAWAETRPDMRILKTDLFEEACGPDAFFEDLSKGGAISLGMDVSPAVALCARRNNRGRQAEYLAADVRQLPLASNTFDLIVSPSTLDHFSRPEDLGRSLRELARVLAPGGVLILTLDNRQNLSDPLLRLLARLGWLPFYLGRSYSVNETRKHLRAAGFMVTDTTAVIHHPRGLGVALVGLSDRLRFPPLQRLVHRLFLWAEHLEETPWRYRSGCFVAARAILPPAKVGSGSSRQCLSEDDGLGSTPALHGMSCDPPLRPVEKVSACAS